MVINKLVADMPSQLLITRGIQNCPTGFENKMNCINEIFSRIKFPAKWATSDRPGDVM